MGTIDSLWDANMDMLAPHNSIDLHDPEWPIYARSPIKPPHATGPHAKISHSLVTGGGQIDGTVENSVLFHSVVVEERPGAVFHPHARRGGQAGADVSYAIVAEDAVIEATPMWAPPRMTAPTGASPWWPAASPWARVHCGPHAMIREDVKGGEQA